MEGTIVGERYELGAKLGAGASAAVYRARDRELGRDVAIKLLHEVPHADEKRRFDREARVASRLRHPDVIEIFDVGDLDGRPFLVMELVDVPSLATAIAEAVDPPTTSTAIAIGERVAATLAAAHAAGIVHRDLKPANVFIEGTLAAPTRCRLSDFGLAFVVAPESEELGRFTVAGTMLGTPLYMSPEQAEGKELGPPTDVYSLGCMIHELIAGRPPFVGNVARVLAGHMYLPPVALREIEPDVPLELEQLVLALLEKDPARRPTAAEAATRFAEATKLARRVRSTTLEPRYARAVDAAPPELDPGAATAVALEPADIALAEALGARAIAIAADAPLVLAGADRTVASLAGRAWIAVHPAPTTKVIADAIRDGAAGVVRWPGSPDVAAAQIRRAWRTIHRAIGPAR